MAALQCKDKCEFYQARINGRMRTVKGWGAYAQGFIRCNNCQRFLDPVLCININPNPRTTEDAIYCPCCGYQTRKKPVNSKSRIALKAIKENGSQ